MEIRAISWNLFHGRDAPPDDALFTWRSKLLRITERDETHVQVNRDLYREFERLLADARWDVALLQECPPRWGAPLGDASDADVHRSLTSRNAIPLLQRLLHRLNPDLVGSWEGGSNVTLARSTRIIERRELEIQRHPERRRMQFTRLESGLCVANLHASNNDPPRAVPEVRLAAEIAVEWSDDAPLIFGGDLNLQPLDTEIFGELDERFDLRPTTPTAIDHLLGRRLEVVEPPRQWPAVEREAPYDGLALRLSDHAPVEALFRVRGSLGSTRGPGVR
jgi:endonuclease/exonuclease/phosphatase family metal-dependent hydrolase